MRKFILCLLMIPCLIHSNDFEMSKEVMNNIIAKAEKKYAGDYFMINHEIKTDVKAYQEYILLKKKQAILNEAK